jgi:hypothetical protein
VSAETPSGTGSFAICLLLPTAGVVWQDDAPDPAVAADSGSWMQGTETRVTPDGLVTLGSFWSWGEEDAQSQRRQ